MKPRVQAWLEASFSPGCCRLLPGLRIKQQGIPVSDTDGRKKNPPKERRLLSGGMTREQLTALREKLSAPAASELPAA